MSKDYLDYCSKTGINTARTQLDYLSGIKRLDDVFISTFMGNIIQMAW